MVFMVWEGEGVGLGGDNEEHDNDRDPDGEGNVRVSWDFWHSVRSLGGWGIFFRADTNFGAFVLSGLADGIRTVVCPRVNCENACRNNKGFFSTHAIQKSFHRSVV